MSRTDPQPQIRIVSCISGVTVTEERPLPSSEANPDAPTPGSAGGVESGPTRVPARSSPARPDGGGTSAPREWLVARIPPGFQVVAECQRFAAIGAAGEASASFDYHSPTGTSPVRITMHIVRSAAASQWALRIIWEKAGQVAYLDEKGGCRGCGRQIVGARVSDKGRVFVWHIE